MRETEYDVEIEEIHLPRFVIDLTKKLSQLTIDRIPFENYKIMTNLSITRLEKEVSRKNTGSMFFPVYDQTQDTQLIIGLLRVSPPNEPELLVYYANFPTLGKIISNV